MVVAAFADPWPGSVRVKAGAATDLLPDRLSLEVPALIGVLLEDLQPGPTHQWDRVNAIIVEMATPDLVSVGESGALDLQNLMLVETADGWELLSFASAELIGASQYRLTGLLRQLRSHRVGPGTVASAGGRCVFIDASVGYGYLGEEDIGRPLVWATEPGQLVQEQVFNQVSQRPWAPRVQSWNAGTGALAWAPRSPAISNDWDQPDPTDVGFFDIAWTPGGETEVMERVSSTSFMVPVGAVQVRLRSVAANGLTGDWVTMSGT